MGKDKADLMEVLRFSEEDIEASRQGRMTESQRALIWWRSSEANFWYIILPVMVLFTIHFRPMIQDDNGAFLVIALFGTLIGTRIAVDVLRVYQDTGQDEVQKIEGVVMKDRKPRTAGNAPRNFYIRIRNTIFKVSPSEISAFEHGKFYRIFYAPRSKVILSAELLTDVEISRYAV